MTKEEAIKYLQQLYPNGGHCWLDEQRIEAVGMAIKALKDEPVSEGLENASEKYSCRFSSSKYGHNKIKSAFKDGAKWQKQKDSMSINKDFEEVVKKLWDEINSGHDYSVIESYNVFYGLCLDIANWNKEQIIKRLCNHANIDQMVEKFEDKYKPKNVFDTEYYKRGIFDTIKAIKED